MSENNFIVYRASAGSGKTYTLAIQYIKQLLCGDPTSAHKHILAVTFTNDAAGEMKGRILNFLYDLSEGKEIDFLTSLQAELPLSNKEIQRRASVAISSILHDYSNFHVTTIDSFFQTIVRNLAKELGVSSRFDIELDIEIPIRDAVKSLIEEASDNKSILSRLCEFVEHKLEDSKWSIEKDLQSFGRKIFDEVFQKNEISIIKNNKDTNKLKNAIHECNKIKKDFESKIDGYITQFFQPNAYNIDNFLNELNLGESDKGRKITVKSTNIKTYFTKLREKYDVTPDSGGVKRLYEYFSSIVPPSQFEFLNIFKYHKDNLPYYNSAKLFMKFVYQLLLLEDIANKLNEDNSEQNRFILANTNRLLSELVGYNDASFVFEKIGTQIRSVIIDEFQDTSELQWKNFKTLISELIANNNFGMLVGDVKQSIYRWRNGNWKILNNIEDEFKDTATYKSLDTNYRSAKNIVEFNNHLFNKMVTILQPEDNYAKPFRKAYKDVHQKAIKDYAGYVSVDFITKNNNEDDDFISVIADKLNFLFEKGISQGDICILLRTNRLIAKIADELPSVFAKKYPCFPEKINIISENAYQFGSSVALKIIISVLRIFSQPDNNISKEELYSLLFLSDPEEVINTKLKSINYNLYLFDLVNEICRVFDLSTTPFLFAFMDKLIDYLSHNTSDIEKFLIYWDEKLKNEMLPLPVNNKRNGILAMTIHKSKGLEFDTVIVPNIDWAMVESSTPAKQHIVWCECINKQFPFDFPLLPIEYNAKMENSLFSDYYMEETYNTQMDSLNVLYVVLTRATQNLIVLALKPSENNTLNRIQDLMYDGKDSFEMGEISPKKKLLYEQDTIDAVFSYNKPNLHVMLSTEVQLFSRGNNEYKTNKIRQGNIIHLILKNIDSFKMNELEKTINTTVDKLVHSNDISFSEKNYYASAMVNYFNKNNSAIDWFSDKYIAFNEVTILAEKEYRPDRVIVDENNNVTIIDYKTGDEKDEYNNQIRDYINLLKNMNTYNSVEGYVWYLGKEIFRVTDKT